MRKSGWTASSLSRSCQPQVTATDLMPGGPCLQDIPGGVADVEGLLPEDPVFLKGVVDLLLLAEEKIEAEDLPEIGIKTEPDKHRSDSPGTVGGDDRENMVLLQGGQYWDEAGKWLHGVVVDRREDLLRGLGESGKIDPPGRHRFVEIAIEKGEVILLALYDRRPDPLETPRNGICIKVQRIGKDAVKIKKKKRFHYQSLPLQLHSHAVPCKIDHERRLWIMDPEVFPRLGQKTIERFVIPGRLAVKEAKTFHTGPDGKLDSEEVAGMAPGLFRTYGIRQ